MTAEKDEAHYKFLHNFRIQMKDEKHNRKILKKSKEKVGLAVLII